MYVEPELLPSVYTGTTSYEYTIMDANGNVVPDVASVTEYFSNTTGDYPQAGTWSSSNITGPPYSDVPTLGYNNVVSGQFVDNLAASPGYQYTATQSFTAQVGGNNYVISTTTSMQCIGICTSTPNP